MRTIIAGPRTATWEQTLEAINTCPWKEDIDLVVSGTADGADTFGEVWASTQKIPVDRFEPEWNKYGRAGGPIRNRQMAENAEALVLVWDGVCRGSKSMLDEATSYGLKIHLHMIEPKKEG